ncbi:MAG: hypothetical protein RBR02_10515 [Desulfuromonadaceae bacterium]|nr:hypothetical protein [Desulfuromonadaceae bacterium]
MIPPQTQKLLGRVGAGALRFRGQMEQVVDCLTGEELAVGIAMGIVVTRGSLDLSASCRTEIRDPDALILEQRQWK